MPMFDSLIESLRKLWTGGVDSHLRLRPPPVTYPTLRTVEKPPRNQEIAPGVVTIVSPARQPRWAMFLCPCGCQTVITLPLQQTKYPHWSFKKSRAGRPTLHPSVWRDVGCFSHFFLDDGRIYWCSHTGASPDDIRKISRRSRGNRRT